MKTVESESHLPEGEYLRNMANHKVVVHLKNGEAFDRADGADWSEPGYRVGLSLGHATEVVGRTAFGDTGQIAKRIDARSLP